MKALLILIALIAAGLMIALCFPGNSSSPGISVPLAEAPENFYGEFYLMRRLDGFNDLPDSVDEIYRLQQEGPLHARISVYRALVAKGEYQYRALHRSYRGIVLLPCPAAGWNMIGSAYIFNRKKIREG